MRRSSTATGPESVSIDVPSARQIGQIGSPAGARCSIAIAPDRLIVPVMRWPSAPPSGGCAK